MKSAFFCASLVAAPLAAAAPQGAFPSMAAGTNGYRTDAILTIGETIGTYTPPGILDGMGAYALDATTVRVFANHELLNFRGYEYAVEDGQGGTFNLRGSRISYFDIDTATLEITGADIAYDRIYDPNGVQATGVTFLPAPNRGDLSGSFQHVGLSRFCSGGLFEPEQFGNGRGLTERAYFCGEEDGGFFNTVSGLVWMLDPETRSLWSCPDLGRGAWENFSVLDTGDPSTVAMILMDDSSPFDADSPFTLPAGTGDADREAAPLYLYVGTKDPGGDFVARQGLRGGQLYVFVPDDQAIKTPAEFNGSGSLSGTWVAIDNTQIPANASTDGSTGYDPYGYPTQRLLWLRAEAAGSFGFSRPEDIATNPFDGTEAVLVSTGVDTYVNGADTFGTVYTIKTEFSALSATVTIAYDGDADPSRALRSPDNLDWADDGFIYVQEDEAEEDTLTGEPLFGMGAVNPNEAGIVRLDPATGEVVRIMNIDRSVIIDPTVADPFSAVDTDAGRAGEWESSGIIDVSSLFGRDLGTLFLYNIQAHGIEDQDTVNPSSRINDDDLVEGGELAFLEFVGLGDTYCFANANSTGAAARIRAEGSALLSDDDVTLFAEGVPAGTPGLFFFGEQQTVQPLGDGFLCVGGALTRTDVVFADGEGIAALDFDTVLNAGLGGVLSGATSNFQFWYRDGATGSNLTDALSIDWR